MSELERSKELLVMYENKMEELKAVIDVDLHNVVYLQRLIDLYNEKRGLNDKIFNLTHEIKNIEREQHERTTKK